MYKAISSQTVYLICFFFLVLNVALFAASWCIHREIKNFYLSSGRDIESLPRPDPFAGLSETAKSNHEGEEPCSIFAPDINQILFGIVRPDYWGRIII